jgi:hypothetical protein
MQLGMSGLGHRAQKSRLVNQVANLSRDGRRRPLGLHLSVYRGVPGKCVGG